MSPSAAEQRVAQRMQQHVTVRVRQQAESVRDPNAAESDEIAFAEAMYVIAVTDTHS